MTNIVFLVTDDRLRLINEGLGYEFDGRRLAELCAQHDRQSFKIPPSGHFESDLNNILVSQSLQAVIDLDGIPDYGPHRPYGYGLDLAYRLTDLGVDVLLLAEPRLFRSCDDIGQVCSGFQTVIVTDVNRMARVLLQFIADGSQFLRIDPYRELIRKQEEAHRVAMASLRAQSQRFLHLKRLAQARRAEIEAGS